MPCSNCHSEGRSLRTKMPIHMDLSTRELGRRAVSFRGWDPIFPGSHSCYHF